MVKSLERVEGELRKGGRKDRVRIFELFAVVSQEQQNQESERSRNGARADYSAL